MGAAYFGFLGMLAITATLDPLLAPRLPAQLSSRHVDIAVPKLPAVLKVREPGFRAEFE